MLREAVVGLGLWGSGLVPDQGWYGGAWHVGVNPRACSSGTGRCLAVCALSSLGGCWQACGLVSSCGLAMCHPLSAPWDPLQPPCAW